MVPVSFLKIRENHEKFVEKVDFFSSISRSGSRSGFRIRIRIQHGNLNPDPPGSATLSVYRTPSLLRIQKGEHFFYRLRSGSGSDEIRNLGTFHFEKNNKIGQNDKYIAQ